MNTPISAALLAACQWLKRHPDLQADPELLLEFVCAWVTVAGPCTEQEARQCGIHAVKEVANCRKEIDSHVWIEPEDLRD